MKKTEWLIISLTESMAKTCNDPTPQLERCILTQRMLLNLCLELDDNFLLRFLRVKKFSIPMAQQTLLKYLNYRKRFPQIFLDMDYSDSSVNQLISSGWVFHHFPPLSFCSAIYLQIHLCQPPAGHQRKTRGDLRLEWVAGGLWRLKLNIGGLF